MCFFDHDGGFSCRVIACFELLISVVLTLFLSRFSFFAGVSDVCLRSSPSCRIFGATSLKMLLLAGDTYTSIYIARQRASTDDMFLNFFVT